MSFAGQPIHLRAAQAALARRSRDHGLAGIAPRFGNRLVLRRRMRLPSPAPIVRKNTIAVSIRLSLPTITAGATIIRGDVPRTKGSTARWLDERRLPGLLMIDRRLIDRVTRSIAPAGAGRVGVDRMTVIRIDRKNPGIASNARAARVTACERPFRKPTPAQHIALNVTTTTPPRTPDTPDTPIAAAGELHRPSSRNQVSTVPRRRAIPSIAARGRRSALTGAPRPSLRRRANVDDGTEAPVSRTPVHAARVVHAARPQPGLPASPRLAHRIGRSVEPDVRTAKPARRYHPAMPGIARLVPAAPAAMATRSALRHAPARTETMTVRRKAARPSVPASPPPPSVAPAPTARVIERVIRETLATTQVEATALAPPLLRSVTDHVCRAVARQADLDRYRRGR